MGQTGFESAFDSVADAVARAAALPDHRERSVVSPSATARTPGGEIEVTIHDGKVGHVHLDGYWVQSTPVAQVENALVGCLNEALDEWSEKHLETLETLTPDMVQLHAAIDTARAKLQDAWVATLAEVKTP